MEQLEKALSLVQELQKQTKLLANAERIELKAGRSGHFRVFVACLPNTPPAVAGGSDEAATLIGYTANPYRKADGLTSVSFVDNDEPARQR